MYVLLSRLKNAKKTIAIHMFMWIHQQSSFNVTTWSQKCCISLWIHKLFSIFWSVSYDSTVP